MDSFSTPFEHTAVNFLTGINVPAYKIVSFEIEDIPLLRKTAETGKPIIISTGMASLAEIDEAVHTVRHTGATQICLLKCTNPYPASIEEMTLRSIPHISETFYVPATFSGNILGIAILVAGVALGACISQNNLLVRTTPWSRQFVFFRAPVIPVNG